MGVHDGRTALTAELRAFDATCRDAGIEPAYVLLRDKRAFQRGWQDRRPTLDEALGHLERSSGNSLGVQPASLGCVVLDCDDGDGPEVAAEWAGDAHAVTTPSSSGLAHKGHVWVRCEAADAVGNWKFQVEDPIDGDAAGELRTHGGQVRLTAASTRLLARAVGEGRMVDGPVLSAPAFAGIRTSGGAASAEGIALDWHDGLEAGLDDLPETLRDRIVEPVGTGDRSEAVASVVWQLLSRGLSAASVLSIVSEHCGFAVEKYGDRLEAQVEKIAIDFLATKAAGIAADFEDVIETEDLPEGATATDEKKGPLARLNDRYCVVNLEGMFRVAYQATDVDPEDNRERTKWCFSSRQSFEDLNMHRRVETAGGKVKALGKAWLEWGGRLQADGVVFDPSSDERIVNHKLNLWTGFSCEPVEGDWSHIRWLIEEALCAGDRRASDYVLDWIAWKVQNPDRLPGVALAFKGAKGAGKTTLGELVASLFGSHGLVLSQREHLTGKFNAHLGTACFVLCDEVDFRHAAGREDSQLKKLVTDRSSMIERKGIDITASTNRLGVMLATNADVVVPASADERRYAVFEVPNTWGTGDGAPNKEEAARRHAEVWTQIASGGREAFLHAMLARRVMSHPRESIPETAALAGQKAAALPLVQRWFLAACEEGELPRPSDFMAATDFPDDNGDPEGDWEEAPQYTTYAEVADAVMRFARDEGVRHKRPSAKAVLKDLHPFGVLPTKHRQRRAWRVPSLPELRDAWTVHLGGSPFSDD